MNRREPAQLAKGCRRIDEGSYRLVREQIFKFLSNEIQ